MGNLNTKADMFSKKTMMKHRKCHVMINAEIRVVSISQEAPGIASHTLETGERRGTDPLTHPSAATSSANTLSQTSSI